MTELTNDEKQQLKSQLRQNKRNGIRENRWKNNISDAEMWEAYDMAIWNRYYRGAGKKLHIEHKDTSKCGRLDTKPTKTGPKHKAPLRMEWCNICKTMHENESE